MQNVAYRLNVDFIDELGLRISRLAETAQPTELFGDLLHSLGQAPVKEHLAAIIDAAFWTSFTTDEGNAVTASIILNQAEDSFDTFRFDEPIPFHVKNLVKLGAALENPRADIGVWPDKNGELKIWGFKTRAQDTLIAHLWVQALGPGRVLITYGGKNLGALTHNKAIFVDHSNLMRSVMPKLTATSAETEDKMLRLIRYGSLLATARAMREHGRGGTLLVVPETDEWKRFIRSPIPFTGGANFLESDYDASQKPSLLTPFSELFSSLRKKKHVSQHKKLFRIRSQVERQCRHIARLTAVDGALIMTFDRYVYCFGAKIIPAEGQEVPAALRVVTPVEGDTGRMISFTDVGGTRHQSAAQFAHAHPGSIGVVVSQDGDVTFFCADSQADELVVVQQAELAVLHEGLGAAIWNYSRFTEMGWL